MKRTKFCIGQIIFLTFLPCFLFLLTSLSFGATFRPPAIPLVVHDPYFSIWSTSDNLADSETKHWTGHTHPLHMMIRLDETTYRLMGAEPANIPAMEQKKLTVLPTTTVYLFENDDARVTLTFTTPLLPERLEWMSRPATYISTDILLKKQGIQTATLYFDAGAEIAVNTPDQIVQWSSLTIPNTKTVQIGTVDQKILENSGDDIRIDWGNLILSVPDLPTQKLKSPFNFELLVGNGVEFRNFFVEQGTLPIVPVLESPSPQTQAQETNWTLPTDSVLESPCSVQENNVVLATVFSLNENKRNQTNKATFILAYDDQYSIRYFNSDLRPYWKRDGKTTEEMIQEAWQETQWNRELKTESVFNLCRRFDNVAITDDIIKIGGADYAKLCSLAYRQVLGAQKIVADANGMPLMFSKENFSNGCIGTVDIMYPCSPFLLYYSPVLLKATLEPIIAYAESKRWPFPFAPHDLGTYPHATGQVYGGGEKREENQMPVEESANMLIMIYAIAFVEGNADFAERHWVKLEEWANYLKEKGFDPENQLCTDDFAGYLAHNTNLSLKAIIGLASFSRLAEMLGKKEIAEEFRQKAVENAQAWVVLANDGDHFRLTFDKPDTWSMKYNLMWDRILDLQLFEPDVIAKELKFYQTKMEKYGLPLDSRSLYTKVDWILWTSSMINSQEQFEKFIDPVIQYINETPQRVPISDWYWTDSAKQCAMQARCVVGGFWAPMLRNKVKWQKKISLAEIVEGDWAPIPLTSALQKVAPEEPKQ